MGTHIPLRTLAKSRTMLPGRMQAIFLVALFFKLTCVVHAQADAPPTFLIQPLSQEVQLGSNATLFACTTGSQPQSFQWLFQGTNLLGETKTNLIRKGLQYQHLGEYEMVASNAFGCVTSAPAMLRMPSVVAWGYNDSGQTNVPILGDVIAIAAGGWNSCALRSDGTLKVWGDTRWNLTQPYPFTNIVQIAVGNRHCLALRADGTVVTWGYYMQSSPVVPTGLSNVISIAAGGEQSVALKADGSVIRWGENLYGDTNILRSVRDFVSISAGYYMTAHK